MNAMTDGPVKEAYTQALGDFEQKLGEVLRKLPHQTANDLMELFSLCAKADENNDEDLREEIAQAIREILFPESLKVELEKGFFEDDLSVRARLTAYRQKVGAEIRRRRESLEMTQDMLAELAGIPQSHVSRLECGKHVPTFVTMEKIARALGTTPGQIDPGFTD